MTVERTGRTGSDALWKLAAHACRIFVPYEAKFRAFAAAQATAGHISAADLLNIYAWIDATKVACAILEVLADFSNVNL